MTGADLLAEVHKSVAVMPNGLRKYLPNQKKGELIKTTTDCKLLAIFV